MRNAKLGKRNSKSETGKWVERIDWERTEEDEARLLA